MIGQTSFGPKPFTDDICVQKYVYHLGINRSNTNNQHNEKKMCLEQITYTAFKKCPILTQLKH